MSYRRPHALEGRGISLSCIPHVHLSTTKQQPAPCWAILWVLAPNDDRCHCRDSSIDESVHLAQGWAHVNAPEIADKPGEGAGGCVGGRYTIWLLVGRHRHEAAALAQVSDLRGEGFDRHSKLNKIGCLPLAPWGHRSATGMRRWIECGWKAAHADCLLPSCTFPETQQPF